MNQELKMRVYTIGHSTLTFEKLISLLQTHQIQVFVDVRSVPYSRHQPQYNKNVLFRSLQDAGIRYIYAGDLLGGRPDDPDVYRLKKLPETWAEAAREIDYAAIMEKEWYLSGIASLLAEASCSRTVIVCSEENPANCHRQHLIAQTLLKKDVEVLHIRSDGQVIPAWFSTPGNR